MDALNFNPLHAPRPLAPARPQPVAQPVADRFEASSDDGLGNIVRLGRMARGLALPVPESYTPEWYRMFGQSRIFTPTPAQT